MTTFPAFNPTPLLLGGFPAYSRQITLASGANAAGVPLLRGTVLGQITSSGLFIVAVETATDGSAEPRCILGQDTDASIANTVTSAYYTGDFADVSCTFGAGHTAITVDAAFASSGQPIFIRVVGSVA
jgi:hypothetical protein